MSKNALSEISSTMYIPLSDHRIHCKIYLPISKRPERVYEVKESERHREYAEEHVGHCQVQDQDVLGHPQLRQKFKRCTYVHRNI